MKGTIVELYQLQTFAIVAEEGTLTRAAQRLYTTPSTISMHIKLLEEELGVELFTRSNQGMSITPKGAQLLEKAKITLQAARDLVNHALDIKATMLGEVAIGLCSTPQFLKIPQLIQRVQSNHAGINLVLEQSTSMQILEALTTNVLDIGFVYGTVSDPILEAQCLTQSELVVAIPAVWPLDFDPADWRELAARPWVSPRVCCPFQQVVDKHLAAQGLTCQYQVQIDDDHSRYDLVKAGIGLSLLERHAVDKGIAAGEIRVAPVQPLCVDLSLVYRAHERHRPLIRCLIDLINTLFNPPVAAEP
jgi:DNA-binding transcriptional LysR family regulator